MKIKYLIALIVAFVFVWAIVPYRNPLKKYGVSYSWVHGEHYAVNIINFWLQTEKGKIDGPCFTGDNLTMDFSYMRDDPIPEIVVRSSNNHSAVARLVIKNGKPVGFHIVKDGGVGIGFAAEGYYGD